MTVNFQSSCLHLQSAGNYRGVPPHLVYVALGTGAPSLTKAGHAPYQLSYSLINVNDVSYLGKHTQKHHVKSSVYNIQYTIHKK